MPTKLPQYSIRRMHQSEVQTAIDWAQKEGWNPGLNDAACFYEADPKGFFVGCLNDEPIAVGSAVIYDEHFAFCGLYIVKPSFRKQGYGLKLTEKRLKYVGDRMTGIDGVLENVSKYEKIGYIASHKQTRYALFNHNFETFSPHIVEMQSIPFNLLENFDQKYFQANRSQFLRCWINQPNCFALGYTEDQQLKGYGVIRKCIEGYKIGPLFSVSPSVAHALFEALCIKVREGPIYLDIPEPNQNAQFLTKYYKMTPKFDVIRMYRNGIPNIDLEGIYGITSFELG